MTNLKCFLIHQEVEDVTTATIFFLAFCTELSFGDIGQMAVAEERRSACGWLGAG